MTTLTDRFRMHFLSGRADSLQRLFGLLSVLAIAAILGLTAVGLERSVRDEAVHHAEEDAVRVGRAIFDQERHLLLTRGGDGVARMEVAPVAMEALNQRMLSYLPPLSMYKIKAFSADKRVVYSTEAKLIGQSESANQKLNTALRSGKPVSEAENKASIWHLAGEHVANATVVESYIPITHEDRTVGAFEVYVDITGDEQRIDRLVWAALGKLLLALVVVFGGLYLIMRRATTRLRAAQEEMERLAATDALTGIANRRHVLERASAEYASATRNRQKCIPQNEIGFIMVDIDHFKQVNDRYGHPVGDEVLREIASRIRRSLREYDVVGRFGGEEFLVMLPHTDLAGAGAVARRVQEAIRGQPTPTAAGPLTITASLGVSFTDAYGTNVAAAIKLADDCLYAAKSAGRDRVVVAPPGAPMHPAGDAPAAPVPA